MASLSTSRPPVAVASRRSSVQVKALFTRQNAKQNAKQAQTAKGGAKAASKGGAYVCADCGYLYPGNDFESLPNSYACPVCAAPKKRFRQFQGSTSRSNDNKTMATRRDALRAQLAARGESVEEDASFLIATAASAAVFLGLVYYFTSFGR